MDNFQFMKKKRDQQKMCRQKKIYVELIHTPLACVGLMNFLHD